MLGNGAEYSLGYNNTTNKLTADAAPVPFKLTTGEVIDEIATGGANNLNNVTTCARTSKSRVFCWGYNTNGQVGDGTTVRKQVPTEITLLGQ